MSRSSFRIAAFVLLVSSAAEAGLIDVGFKKRALNRPPAEAAVVQGIESLTAGKVDDAEKAFRESLRLQSDQALAWVGLADVALARKDPKGAESSLRTAIARVPDEPGAYEALGRFLDMQGRPAEAEPALRRALDLDPSDTGARIALADVLARGLGRPQQAIAEYRTALASAPDHAGGHFGLGLALQKTGQPKEAVVEFEKAAALEPKNPLPSQAIGEAQVTLGNTDAAMQAFQAAITKNPAFYLAYLSRGDVLLARNDPQAAAAEYVKATEAAPRLAGPPFKAATAYEAARADAKATAMYEEALRRDPKFAPALNNLAWAAAERGGNLDEALARARKAVELDARNAAYVETLGWVEVAGGQSETGLRTLRRAAALDPKNAGIQYTIGRAAEKVGRVAEAKAAYARALQLDPRHAGAAEAAKRLGR